MIHLWSEKEKDNKFSTSYRTKMTNTFGGVENVVRRNLLSEKKLGLTIILSGIAHITTHQNYL